MSAVASSAQGETGFSLLLTSLRHYAIFIFFRIELRTILQWKLMQANISNAHVMKLLFSKFNSYKSIFCPIMHNRNNSLVICANDVDLFFLQFFVISTGKKILFMFCCLNRKSQKLVPSRNSSHLELQNTRNRQSPKYMSHKIL